MAKSSVPGLDRNRDLFTSAELAVLESTVDAALAGASRRQLEKALVQARTLRDKWRDLHAAQSRTSKRSAGVGGTAANARSRDKSDILAAAVERVQARLADLGHDAPAGTSAGKRPSKPARTAGHRTARAGVKSTLAAAAAGLNRRPTAKPPVRSPAAPAPAAAAAPATHAKPAAPAAAAAKKPTSRAASGRKRPAVAPAVVVAAGANQRVRFDVAKQRSAKASATAARIKLDGKLTRRGGHTLAAGKRRQAVRDKRSR